MKEASKDSTAEKAKVSNAKISGSGRMELVMLSLDSKKIGIA